ncbi:MAG: cation transporter [Candidatus Omnitrophica bacterium]|nr:cation transporter [Candidatus Omnitrophota bacterium]
MNEKIVSLRWAIILSSCLSVLKAAAGLFSASTALLASALDSLMDVGISSVNYLAVQKGAKPPDEDHAYGHEKIESLASYTQGIIIILFAALLFIESIRRSVAGASVLHSNIAIGTVIVATFINLILTQILGRAEKKTGSLILKAENAHYSMDILSYLAIFLALLLVRITKWSGWDIVGGILVAGYVAFLAAQILIQAGNELVDRSLPKRFLDELDLLIKNHDPRILGYHEMRTRKVGTKTFIDFHLVMKPKQSFENAHAVAESLIEKIRFKFQNVDVTIHEDPEGGI